MIENIASDRGMKWCESGLKFFAYVDQNVLVFCHPKGLLMAKITLDVGNMWKYNSLTQIMSRIIVVYTHVTRFCYMKMMSKCRRKGLSTMANIKTCLSPSYMLSPQSNKCPASANDLPHTTSAMIPIKKW